MVTITWINSIYLRIYRRKRLKAISLEGLTKTWILRMLRDIITGWSHEECAFIYLFARPTSIH